MMITIIARFFAVAIPMTILYLMKYRVHYKTLIFVWYGGLIRGAIAYALTFRVDRSLSR